MATTEIYTLSLHDALPIWLHRGAGRNQQPAGDIGGMDRDGATGLGVDEDGCTVGALEERNETVRSEEHTSELQSVEISYAVFCLKKKNNSKGIRASGVIQR